MLFCLCSCQSSLQKLGQKHKTSLEKWHELAKFSESEISSFNINLLATFSVNNQSENLYELDNFRLSASEGFFDINLLKPSIANKFVCQPACKQLSELIIFDGKNRGVLSNLYFNQKEFDLFKFYGDLYLLNKNIDFLNQYPKPLINKYMLFLANQNQRFSNVNDFLSYLKLVLNKKAFSAFVNDPSKRFDAIDTNPLESVAWVQNALSDVSETNAQGSIESLLWIKDEISNSETSIWVSDQVPDSESLKWNEFDATSTIKDRVSNFEAFYIGDIVCHGPSNSFGLVNKIQGRNATVQLAGEFRDLVEGILVTPSPNDILKMTGTINFIKLDQLRTYSIDEIEKCNVFNGE